MIKRCYQFFLREQSNSIGVAALIVAFFGILSRLLGLVRDRMLAANYGAGDVLDVYYAAFRLPDLLFELLIVGSLAAAFIPIYNKLSLSDDKESAWRLANDLLLLLTGIVSILAIVGIIFAPQLMHFVTPGFPEEKMAMAGDFARIMYISPLFLAMSAVLGSVLVSMRRFLLYASAPLLYNIGIIIGIVYFAPHYGHLGLAWGVVLGAFMHFVVHIIALRQTSFTFLLPVQFPYKNPNVRRVLRLMLPRIVGSASNQMSLLLITLFASLLTAGSLTMFTFAYNIQSVVLGLVGISFALAAFPILSTAYAKGDEEYFEKIFDQTLRRIFYYAIPASMLLWVLRAQIIRIVYGAGHFDWEATVTTVQIVSILTLSLFAQCAIPLLARMFYARQDTKTPLYAALIGQVVNLILLVVLLPELRIIAIAVAFSCATFVNAGILFYFAHRRLTTFPGTDLFPSVLRVTSAALAAAFVAHTVKTFIGTVLDLNLVWEVLVQFGVAGMSGVLMYLGMSALFKIPEFETIKNQIFFRMFGRPSVASESQNVLR